jgi:hypothetical protein
VATLGDIVSPLTLFFNQMTKMAISNGIKTKRKQLLTRRQFAWQCAFF